MSTVPWTARFSCVSAVAAQRHAGSIFSAFGDRNERSTLQWLTSLTAVAAQTSSGGTFHFAAA
jgi:hypothetical protein